MSIRYDNIGELVTNDATVGDGSALGVINDGALIVDGDRVAWLGPRAQAPDADDRVDCGARSVLPGFVDSHAHLVFAGDRSAEFAARMSGQPYDGGGIATTVSATRAASDAELSANVGRLAGELIRAGVTTFETKSGYGLNVDDERRSFGLDPNSHLRQHFSAHMWCRASTATTATATSAWSRATCCRRAGRMPAGSTCSATAARSTSTRPGSSWRPASGRGWCPDCTPPNWVPARASLWLSNSARPRWTTAHTPPTPISRRWRLLPIPPWQRCCPGAEFSTRAKWPDARRFIDAGATVALATDCNPGSSYTTNMGFCIAVAVRDMGFTPAEAVWAATAGGAAALRREDIGVLRVGNRADFLILDAPSYIHLAYRPGVPIVRDVVAAGVHRRTG